MVIKAKTARCVGGILHGSQTREQFAKIVAMRAWALLAFLIIDYNCGMSYFNHSNFPLCNYSFDGENAANRQTERFTAKAYREALEDLLLAKTNLENAQAKVPNYTGQWNDADYTRDEEQTLIAASHVFEDAMVASVMARMAELSK